MQTAATQSSNRASTSSNRAAALHKLARKAKTVPMVFSAIKPVTEPVTYYLALPDDNAKEMIELLFKHAETNVFHGVSKTRHSDLIKVQLSSSKDKAQLEKFVQG